MNRYQSSFLLSPHKISLCILLSEAFQSPVISLQKQEALIKYILKSLDVRATILFILMRIL